MGNELTIESRRRNVRVQDGRRCAISRFGDYNVDIMENTNDGWTEDGKEESRERKEERKGGGREKGWKKGRREKEWRERREEWRERREGGEKRGRE